MRGQPARLVRFVLVGILNTGFSYAVYALLLAAGVEYRLANLGALLLGILFSFKTQSTLVFRNDNNRLLLRYVLGWAIVYGCNIALIGQCIRFGASAYLAGALALPVTTVVSYLIQTHMVFRKPGNAA